MLLFKVLSVFQPPHSWCWISPSWTAKLDRVGRRHGVKSLFHLVRVGPIRCSCFGKQHYDVVGPRTSVLISQLLTGTIILLCVRTIRRFQNLGVRFTLGKIF